MTTTVNIHEAKTHFSKLLARVRVGEEVIIDKAGKPAARLVPVEGRPGKRVAGSAAGKVVVMPDFDEPLPKDVLKALEK